MDDHTRLDLKVPDVAPANLSSREIGPDTKHQPRHRAPGPSPSAMIFRTVIRMVEALGLSALGLCVFVSAWLAEPAPLMTRAVAVGAGFAIAGPLPLVMFWCRIRDVYRVQ